MKKKQIPEAYKKEFYACQAELVKAERAMIFSS
jgi:hypothetical protein